MKKNILVGTRYYDDEKVIYKIVKVKNKDTFTLSTLDGKNKFTKSRDELDSNYTKLTPNGYIIVSVVENPIPGKKDLQKDVLVALYRTKQSGKESELNLPYCVCRQNIVNVFWELMPHKGPKPTHCGMSITIDNCPTDINYELTISCQNVKNNIAISVYMDDDLDDILKLFKHDIYDTVLKSGTVHNNFRTHGYVGTLRELLDNESFSRDYYKAFNIEEIDFELNYNDDTFILDREQTMYFENMYKYEMFDAFAVKFDYTIRLNEIKKKYFMVYSKPEKQLYLIVYTEGKYYNEHLAEEIKNIKNQSSFFKVSLIK